MKTVEQELERTRAERYGKLRELLESSADRPARPFLELEGSIKVGPGSVSEDIRRAREMSDRL